MKLFQNSCKYNTPFEPLTGAHWQKYPNPATPHVIAVDTLRRSLNADGTVLTTERLITCKQSIPCWIRSLLGVSDVSHVREVSTVDLMKRQLTLRSVNLTYSDYFKVREEVRYLPDPERPYQSTIFEQDATITAFGKFRKVCDRLEDWGIRRFGDNAKRGKIGFDWVLEKTNDQ